MCYTCLGVIMPSVLASIKMLNKKLSLCKRGHISRRYKHGGCIACSKLRSVELREEKRAKYLANKEIISVKRKIFREENKEKIREQKKIYRTKNIDKLRKNKRDYYIKNRDIFIKKTALWRKNNPEKNLANHQERRSRKKNAAGKHTGNDIIKIMLYQNNLCVGCGKKISKPVKGGELLATVDHKIPLSKGGSNWPDNLQMLCLQCNIEKNDMNFDEWLKITKER